MRLNPDCVRDILLTVESNSKFSGTIQYGVFEEYPKLLQYSEDEFLYHVNQCKLCGFFTSCNISPQGDMVMIGDLTPSAHEFIANIREDENYSKVKSALIKVGSYALSFIPQVAAKVIQNNINTLL